MTEKLILILGGARSGKSRFAQQLAKSIGPSVLYIATARVLDEEMERRVAVHRADRPPGWQTLEASDHLDSALQDYKDTYDAILLDCVTLLLSGSFLPLPEDVGEEELIHAAGEALSDLLKAVKRRPEPWIVVSNEIGLGIVPETFMGRVFRDAQGRANQQLAALADEVYFMAAGIPLKIK
ncbi:MAG: bifunctional adenosylcobinamide kinase/adenosylcobinamide-phosphate guanylyltransferase [Leptolinea sp.]|jgi:adenosyl cobinamide kinase/adenosyl cobinamide phosphate guanylyltransferase|nr:bifunctional adenosylcobinamide kinase/adenosylcobinamide-phosphate guanylyltransferase [Leptolinea sp.]